METPQPTRSPSPSTGASFFDEAEASFQTPIQRRDSQQSEFSFASSQTSLITQTPNNSQQSIRTLQSRRSVNSSQRTKRGRHRAYTIEDRVAACSFLSKLRNGFDSDTTAPTLPEQYELFKNAFNEHPRLRAVPRQTLEMWYQNSIHERKARRRGRPTILQDKTLDILHLVIKELIDQMFPIDFGWLREVVCILSSFSNHQECLFESAHRRPLQSKRLTIQAMLRVKCRERL